MLELHHSIDSLCAQKERVALTERGWSVGKHWSISHYGTANTTELSSCPVPPTERPLSSPVVGV